MSLCSALTMGTCQLQTSLHYHRIPQYKTSTNSSHGNKQVAIQSDREVENFERQRPVCFSSSSQQRQSFGPLELFLDVFAHHLEVLNLLVDNPLQGLWL